MLSVSSSSRSPGASPASRTTAATQPTMSVRWNWRADRLTATGTVGTPAARQARHWSTALFSTHSPISTISPASSATGMNSTGETRPCCGWRQRSSTSSPATEPSFSAIFGWYTRNSSLWSSAARSWLSMASLRLKACWSSSEMLDLAAAHQLGAPVARAALFIRTSALSPSCGKIA
jgi:hypothetical protein